MTISLCPPSHQLFANMENEPLADRLAIPAERDGMEVVPGEVVPGSHPDSDEDDEPGEDRGGHTLPLGRLCYLPPRGTW